MQHGNLSRREILRLMSLGMGGLLVGAQLGRPNWVAAQSAVGDAIYADDLALTLDEIEQIRAAGLRFSFIVDRLNGDSGRLLVRAAREMAVDYGITLVVNDSALDTARQGAVLDSQIAAGADAIAVFALNQDALSAGLVRANQANIPLVVGGGRPSAGQPVTVIQSTNFVGCYEAARELISAAGGSGQIGIISCGLALDCYREGERGVLQAIAETQMQPVDIVPALSLEEATAVAVDMLDSSPELGAIFAAWDLALDGTMAALEGSKRAVKVAGYGSGVASFAAFEDNDRHLLALSGEQSALTGRAALVALCKAALDQPVAPSVFTRTLLVTPDNFRQRWDQLYPGEVAPWATSVGGTPTPGA